MSSSPVCAVAEEENVVVREFAVDPARTLELVEGDGERLGELHALLEARDGGVVGVVGFVEEHAERDGEGVGYRV